jgi:hypothetical protein
MPQGKKHTAHFSVEAAVPKMDKLSAVVVSSMSYTKLN